MHLPINVKSPNNISKWKVGFNSAFKGLNLSLLHLKQILGYSKNCDETPSRRDGNLLIHPMIMGLSRTGLNFGVWCGYSN
jgi:hypothetical protein